MQSRLARSSFDKNWYVGAQRSCTNDKAWARRVRLSQDPVCAIAKLPERRREAPHGVRGRDGAAPGVQPGPRLHHRSEPLLPAPQRISSKLRFSKKKKTLWQVRRIPTRGTQPVVSSFQRQVIQMRLHSVRRIYKRRHGLRPLVSMAGWAQNEYFPSIACMCVKAVWPFLPPGS